MNEMEELTHCSLWICRGCLDGAGSECHTPGCGFFMNRAPDTPLKSAEPISEDLARARAQGRVEGMREMLTFTDPYIGPEPRDFTSHRQRQSERAWIRKNMEVCIAAAERELAGGKESDGVD